MQINNICITPVPNTLFKSSMSIFSMCICFSVNAEQPPVYHEPGHNPPTYSEMQSRKE